MKFAAMPQQRHFSARWAGPTQPSLLQYNADAAHSSQQRRSDNVSLEKRQTSTSKALRLFVFSIKM